MSAKEKGLIILVSGLIFLASSRAAAQRMDVFASFENQAEVEGVKASDGVLLRQSSSFPTWGDNSLEVSCPADGGTITLKKIPTDWRRSEAFLFFVWSDRPGEIAVVLNDEEGNKYNKTFPVRTGANHIQVRLERAIHLDLGRMSSVELVTGGPGKFYMDYFTLDRFHPILEERGRWDFDYTMKIETPHVSWGRPLQGGPISVFALSGVIDGRGIIELAERLELNYRATTIGIRGGTNMYGFGDFYSQRRGPRQGYTLAQTYIADDLLNGPKYDVILWPALRPWEEYPPVIRETIRKRVEEGAGLIIFYPLTRSDQGKDLWEISPLTMIKEFANIWPEDPVELDSSNVDKGAWRATGAHYITRGVPLEAFPQGHLTVLAAKPSGQVLIETEKGNPVLAVKSMGKGRVAAFAYNQRGMIPEVPDLWDTGLNYPYHEYMWSLVARTVVWAAGREPEAAIERTERTAKGLKVFLTGAPANSRLVGRLSDSFGQTEKEIDTPVPAGKKDVTVELPGPLAGGRHFADLRLVHDGRSLDWAAVTVEEEPGVIIQAVETDTEMVNAGDPITGRITLAVKKKIACAVTVRLFDNYGRLLDQATFELSPTGNSSQAFSLNSSGALTHLARIDCEVRANGLAQDRKTAEIFVRQKRLWDDYDIVMYLFGPNPMPGIWPTIDSQLQRLYVTTLSSYPLDHCRHANYMVQAQTRISGQESPDGGPDRTYYDEMKKKYVETKDKMGLVRKYCLHDPAYRERIKQELKQLCTPWVPFSPLSYYVYEEPSFTCYGDALDICFSEHTLRAMREWLKIKYGTLEVLNTQWGTGFASWDQVVPDDTYEAQARGNYASWADHRTFMEKSYADCYRYVLEELQKLDPQARVLNSGTQESYPHNGCDYSQLNLYTTHLNAYQYEIHRSMNPEVKISGGSGYGVMGKQVFYDLYERLFKGANGGCYIFWQYCTIDPDLTLNHSARDMEQGLREMRGEGIGKLVGLAVPDNHGIAIHYSYPSIHGTWIVDGKISERVSYNTSETFNRFNQNSEGWMNILRDSGLQFDFIAYSAVEKGELISKGYKTFVLPMSVALSEAEVEAIRKFVEQGGTIVTDALPGVMDEHCTFRKNRALQEVFGVQFAPAGRKEIIALTGETGLKLKGAKPLAERDGRPILLYNSYGQGKAFLLNYFLDSYLDDRREGRNQEDLDHISLVLQNAGVQPKIRLTDLAGRPVTTCERYLFNNGTTRLLGLVPGMSTEGSQKVRVSLPGSFSIYDVRNKRFIGTGGAFETEIEPGVPALFAMVADRVRGIRLDFPRTGKLGETVKINFTIDGLNDLSSVAKIVVTDPAGRQLRYYGGNSDITTSAGHTAFRTALNDPKGDWVVEVTEVMSGESARAVIGID